MQDTIEQLAQEFTAYNVFKNHVNGEFFDPVYGDVYLDHIDEKNKEIVFCDEWGNVIQTFQFNMNIITKTGYALMYPDCASFQKYPRQGKTAWREFKSGKKSYQIRIDMEIVDENGKFAGGIFHGAIPCDTYEEAEKMENIIKNIVY